MVAQFPEPSPTPGIPTLEYLQPKVNFSIAFNHLDGRFNGSTSTPYKTVDVDITIHNIQISLIPDTFTRIANYISQAVANDMNPTVEAGASSTIEYTQPQIYFSCDVNHLDYPHKTVDLEVKIQNVMATLIQGAFTRISTYISQTVTTDMNPTVQIRDKLQDPLA